jgi:hypothetical protein
MRGRLVIRTLGEGRFTFEVVQRQWATRLQATISHETARRVVHDLLASERIPPLQATLPATRHPRPALQRFGGTVCQDNDRFYLSVFINDCCLVLPLQGVRSRHGLCARVARRCEYRPCQYSR